MAVTAGRILASHPTDCDTILIADGRVEALTRRDQVGDTPTVDYGDAAIVPAFTDSHLHPLGYTALLSGTSLKEATSMAELGEILGAAARDPKTGEGLVAHRLDDASLGRLPDRHDLDQAVPSRPLLVYRYDGHVAVANSVALALAGIDAATPDPVGGIIDRDQEGRPTGVLRETAIEMVAGQLEPRLRPPQPEAVVTAMDSLLAAGITHIGAMASTGRPLWAGVGDEVAGLCEVAAELPIHVDVMVITDTPAQLRRAAGLISSAGGRLRFWGWKSFADGSLGGHTAAMHTPFADVSTRGTLRLDPDRDEEMARTALDLGGVVAVHAIGDQAIDLTLDLFDRLIVDGHPADRLRIEHVSVPTPQAITRMAATGVIASVQPSFLTSEASWVPGRLGPERTAYPLRDMADAGVRMIGGSDCPVERPDPLLGINAAVHRPGWDDDQQLSLTEALELYTGAPAAHFHRPQPLRAGSPADFLVVDDPGGAGATITAVYGGGSRRTPRYQPWPD